MGDGRCNFIHECGYFFLATAVNNQPRLRPFGMIYSNGKALFIVTVKRKSVYSDLQQNPLIELASNNLNTRKWIRITGKVEVETASSVIEDILKIYPLLKQKYQNENEMFLVIYKVLIENISIS